MDLLSVKTMPAFVLRWVYRCDCWEMPVVVNQVVGNDKNAYLHNTATPWRTSRSPDLPCELEQCSSDSTRFLKCPLTSISVRPEASRSPNWINGC